ncbi:MAG: L,D-transpeptidase family protein [Gammaproteobacteria bacterium]
MSAEERVWLLVDTEALTLEVKKGDKTVDIMKNISIGRNGAGFKMQRGDDVTPLGVYRIGWINDRSTFYRFFGLSYPSVDNAFVAFERGLIGSSTFDAIISAHANNRIPPQNTELGGQIGIHGVGKGNLKIHNAMNWTHGCIALTNSQIDRLSHWIKKETIVRVK